MLRRTLSTLANTALLPVRGATLLYRAGQAHQHFFQPVLNGALGDQLAVRHDPRAITLSFRRGGQDVPVAKLGLSEFKQKTVIFIHGLMGDELIWQTGFQDAPAGPLRYGPRLAAEAGCRPLYLRYNSGLHISENGRALSQLLTALVETYPEAIGELVLVGHSMGGLLIRSAGYYASSVSSEQSSVINPTATKTSKRKSKKLLPDDCSLLTETAPWLAHLRTVFLLGVPNEGSYLEQNGQLVERLLRRINLFPTRFLSQAIARRSNGIKDLGQALLVDEDWQQPDDPALPRPRTTVPLLPGVRYHVLVGDWLRASRPQALRDYFGDGMVGAASARARYLAMKPSCRRALWCAWPALGGSTTAGCCSTPRCINTCGSGCNAKQLFIASRLALVLPYGCH
ncbi:alpha/beta hydrolase [Hymenobacter sp. BRD128]|uniref:alpha/beta fold hydrolase n=1 Tax=Hymenobacter sp. BRD128 TaxID=2675878 RepID=UPI0015673778|nr:alpha/beta fold hydrolase [Hymenobacter sp. BRD128]QKG58613.1 alpha/beta hydrolase [Hymenobacter sp. BRD128]